jgi:hypothetical protein
MACENVPHHEERNEKPCDQERDAEDQTPLSERQADDESRDEQDQTQRDTEGEAVSAIERSRRFRCRSPPGLHRLFIFHFFDSVQMVVLRKPQAGPLTADRRPSVSAVANVITGACAATRYFIDSDHGAVPGDLSLTADAVKVSVLIRGTKKQ